MKKNIIIGLLIVVSILSLIFGFIQKKRADEFEAKLSEKLLKEEEIIKNTNDLDEKIQRIKKESIKDTNEKSIQ